MKEKSTVRNMKPIVYINDDLTGKEEAFQKKMSNIPADKRQKGLADKIEYRKLITTEKSGNGTKKK